MKNVLSILFALMLCIALAVPALAADAPRLQDSADLLTSSEERTLLAELDGISETYQVDVIVAAVDSTRGYGADWYVEAFYDENGYGFGPGRDGVILLVAMEERDYRILCNGFAAEAITRNESDDIGDQVAEELSAGEYMEAFMEFASLCRYEIDGEINGFPFDLGLNLAVSLAIGFVVALIATGIMRAQLRSVRSRHGAGEYTRPGSMHLTRSGDLFLYRTLDRRRRPQDTSGSRGGGGGSRHVSGGKF